MTTITERIDFIKKIHLFVELSDDDLNDVARALTDETHQAGDRIIEQGSHGETFYIVYSGAVNVMRRKGKQEEVQLAQLVMRDYFGEEELFHKKERSASIVAETDCELLVLHARTVAELMKNVPSFKPTFDVVISSHKLWRRLRFKWVRPEEAVYFLARKHPIVLWRMLTWPLLTLILPTLGFLWGITTSSMVAIITALAFTTLNLLWILWRIIDWTNDYYMVTNQRVAWVEKIIGIFDSRTEAPLNSILSVGVETDMLGRILDYGTVVVRTFVGKIPLSYVGHPRYAARMVEEYWNRTKEFALKAEKEAIKDAIRKRLDLPIPPKPEPVKPEPTKYSPIRHPNVLQLALSNIFKLRLEEGDTITYRKHGFVLFQHIWQPSLIMLILLAAFLWRIGLLIAGQGRWPDAMLIVLPVAGLPFFAWWLYQYVDWANDIFQVTPDQVIDIDKKPLGTEERRAASLESILSIESKRVGLLGNIFNYGTVYIVVGGSKLEFQDVFDPNMVQSDIDRRRMGRIASKAAAQAALDRERMAEWIATYHRGSEDFRREESLKEKTSMEETHNLETDVNEEDSE